MPHLCYCANVDDLFEIGIRHEPQHWRLFIDSSVHSLKAVLLHNTNELPSVPVAYTLHMNENYENVKNVLEQINYGRYKWEICGDLR